MKAGGSRRWFFLLVIHYVYAESVCIARGDDLAPVEALRRAFFFHFDEVLNSFRGFFFFSSF